MRLKKVLYLKCRDAVELLEKKAPSMQYFCMYVFTIGGKTRKENIYLCVTLERFEKKGEKKK